MRGSFFCTEHNSKVILRRDHLGSDRKHKRSDSSVHSKEVVVLLNRWSVNENETDPQKPYSSVEISPIAVTCFISLQLEPCAAVGIHSNYLQ